mgnify:CR=1 FL=1
MGNTLSTELADMDISLRRAISIQLQTNHYPAVPLSMVDPCIEAIEACNEEDYNRLIKLPEGVKWRGETSAPAWAIIEAHQGWILVRNRAQGGAEFTFSIPMRAYVQDVRF